jgi:hypothetical protein
MKIKWWFAASTQRRWKRRRKKGENEHREVDAMPPLSLIIRILRVYYSRNWWETPRHDDDNGSEVMAMPGGFRASSWEIKMSSKRDRLSLLLKKDSY